MRNVAGTEINNGGGLYDNEGLCDTLISDCNNLVKHACSGQYIQFCNTVVQMVKKIVNLKNGIKADMESKNETIERLKQMNAELEEEKTGLPVERGIDNGTD
jgi:hypothetical protein